MLTLPNTRLLTVGADRNRGVAPCGLDMQHRALTIADAFGHADVDKKDEAVPLEHLAGVALLPVFKENGLVLMALNEVRHP